ncbi:MAG: hypothetical protein ACN6Q5_03080 [Pseudomonas sp.]|uniref:hypothetical protein n=1 Tax=Pseudomonas sp. TaxID=306 RepID=UPI003D0E3A27
MSNHNMPNQTTPEKPTHTPNDGNAIVSESAYTPNAVNLKVRLRNIALSATLLIYGTFGVVTDNFMIPTKRGILTLYGYPAWVMYGALLCLVANLTAVIIDHYDTRNNEGRYKKFEALVRKIGWALFGLALILSLVKHAKDYVCEDRVILQTTSENTELTAIAYNRYCALHNPLNAIEPLLQISVIPAASIPPAKFKIAANMNSTDIVRMYWTGKKLTLEYRPRQDKNGKKALPVVYSDSPVPVELINVSPNPVVQGARRDKAAQEPGP